VNGDLPLSPDDVAEIVAILDRTPYQRIDIRSQRFSLSVMRSGDGWVQTWEWPDAKTDSTGVDGNSTGHVPAGQGLDEELSGLQTVKALLPGTFYRAPQPGAPAFVDVGSHVEPDTVIGIIETMKLMTPVHAGVNGIVVAILVENTALVAANSALVRIEPAAK
jgi:acetyl-CoA carboxylase biotin carboxyl carrier protein